MAVMVQKNYICITILYSNYIMTSQNQQPFAGSSTPINKISVVLAMMPYTRALAFKLLLLSRRHSIKKLYELLNGYLYKHLQGLLHVIL